MNKHTIGFIGFLLTAWAVISVFGNMPALFAWNTTSIVFLNTIKLAALVGGPVMLRHAFKK